MWASLISTIISAPCGGCSHREDLRSFMRSAACPLRLNGAIHPQVHISGWLRARLVRGLCIDRAHRPWVDDCEVWRLHYYWTVRNWRLRFEGERAAVVALMGERFARMWEFYLGAAELGFLHGANMVFQILLERTP